MSEHALVQWLRQMAVLLHCGIPTVRALEACAKQTSSPPLRAATAIMLAELKVGQRVSEAMRQAGSPFTELHCGAVEMGERQGDLGLVFERLADHTEETARVRRRIISALSYPALVMAFSLSCLYLLVRFLAPVLVDVTRQLGQAPGRLTSALMGLGRLFESEVAMLVLMALLFLAGRALHHHLWQRRRAATERCLLRLPLLGKILRLSALIRICRTLGMMLAAGLPLTEAFMVAARGCGSLEYAEKVLLPAVERVRRGEGVRMSLLGAPGLPPSFTGLVLAGEESGRLEESLAHLGRLYELELVTAIESFLAALEPIAIAVVGSLVLSVLLVVFVPLTRLVSVV